MFGRGNKQPTPPPAPWALQFVSTISHPFVNEKSLRPLVDAEITCRLPGSTLQSWRVPWLLLNGRQLHAFQLG